MASRLFLRCAVLQLRRSFNSGGLPLPDGGGFSRPLVGFTQVGGWAGRPRTGGLDLPGVGRFLSGSGSGGQSSSWLNRNFTNFVAAVLPVFIVDRYQKYKLVNSRQKLESAVEKLYDSYVQHWDEFQRPKNCLWRASSIAPAAPITTL